MLERPSKVKRIAVAIALLVFAFFIVVVDLPSEQPLSRDDLTLLLMGGATPEKLVPLIEKRGVSFQMDPDLAKKFRDLGADDAVIDALQKASSRLNSSAPAPNVPSASAAVAKAAGAASAAPSSSSGAARLAPSPANANRPAILSAPNPEQIGQVIQEFARKERLFREARNNYTYHQINEVQEIDVDGNVVGLYEQDWDILYDDNGKRVERVTYAPLPTLKNLLVTGEDLNAMRNIQPFVLTTDDLPDYDIKYLDHVKLDELTAYVFSIRPKEIKKGRLYFQGVVWVDDRDLQIVKSEGKSVPEVRAHKGQFNLFPRFGTYREQIDGKYWFPTFTMADDTLYFPGAPVHVREIIKYTDYKQFKASSNIKIITELPTEEPKGASKNPPPKK